MDWDCSLLYICHSLSLIYMVLTYITIIFYRFGWWGWVGGLLYVFNWLAGKGVTPHPPFFLSSFLPPFFPVTYCQYYVLYSTMAIVYYSRLLCGKNVENLFTNCVLLIIFWLSLQHATEGNGVDLITL